MNAPTTTTLSPRPKPKPREDPAAETLSRTRRIETRLTQLIVQLGFDTESQKPIFDAGTAIGDATLRLPSPHSSLKEMLAAIPPDFNEAVDVYLGDEYVATVRRPPI